MADSQTAGEVEDRTGKFEDILLLVFCFLIAVGGLVAPVWLVATGNLLSIDGLWLAGISLTLAAVFGGNLAWSIYSGELNAILGRNRKDVSTEAAPQPPAPGSK